VAGETEIERMVVRLIGDAHSYQMMLKQAQASTKSAAMAIQAQTTGIQRLSTSLTALGGKFRAVGTAMRGFGRSMSMYVTAPLALVGGASLKAFANFDNAMIESTSIMRLHGKEGEATKKRMRELALELSGKAPQSATELAKAYYYLASAGKNAEQSMALMPKMMKFATAGAFDMAQATDLLTDAQSALGMSSKDPIKDAENMGKVSDVLVKANTLANASVEQFSKALTTKAGAAFKAYNIPLEEGVALLAAYADQGIKGELAGNMTSRMLLLLTKATRDNSAAFETLGVNVFDAQGEFLPMNQIIGSLSKALKNYSTEQKAAALEALGFEARVQAAILPLLNTERALGDYADALRDAQGITDEVAEEQLKSFANQMKILWNQIKNVGIEIGQMLVPYMEWLSEKIKEGIEWWKGLSPWIKKTIIFIGVLAAVIGPLVLILGLLFSAVGTVISGLGWLVGAIGTAVTWFGSLSIAGGILTGVTTVLSTAMSVLAGVFAFLTSPIGLVIAGVTAIGLAIAWLLGFDVAGWAKKAWGWVKGFFGFGKGKVKTAGMLDEEAGTTLKDSLKDFSKNANLNTDEIAKSLGKNVSVKDLTGKQAADYNAAMAKAADLAEVGKKTEAKQVISDAIKAAQGAAPGKEGKAAGKVLSDEQLQSLEEQFGNMSPDQINVDTPGMEVTGPGGLNIQGKKAEDFQKAMDEAMKAKKTPEERMKEEGGIDISKLDLKWGYVGPGGPAMPQLPAPVLKMPIPQVPPVIPGAPGMGGGGMAPLIPSAGGGMPIAPPIIPGAPAMGGGGMAPRDDMLKVKDIREENTEILKKVEEHLADILDLDRDRKELSFAVMEG